MQVSSIFLAGSPYKSGIKHLSVSTEMGPWDLRVTRAGGLCHQLASSPTRSRASASLAVLPLPPSFSGYGPTTCHRDKSRLWGVGDQNPHSWQLPQHPPSHSRFLTVSCWNLDPSVSPHVMDGPLVFPGQGLLSVPHPTAGPSQCLSAHGPLVSERVPQCPRGWDPLRGPSSLSVPRGGRDPSASPQLTRVPWRPRGRDPLASPQRPQAAARGGGRRSTAAPRPGSEPRAEGKAARGPAGRAGPGPVPGPRSAPPRSGWDRRRRVLLYRG